MLSRLGTVHVQHQVVGDQPHGLWRRHRAHGRPDASLLRQRLRLRCVVLDAVFQERYPFDPFASGSYLARQHEDQRASAAGEHVGEHHRANIRQGPLGLPCGRLQRLQGLDQGQVAQLLCTASC